MTVRVLPHPLLTPLLAGIWLLLNDSLAFGHVLLGLSLGWLIPLFTLRFWPDTVNLRRPGLLVRFLGVVAWDIFVANLAVARLILAGPRKLRPALVAVPLALETELAISLLANTVCLTPGTVSARLSPDRRVLWVHALDAPDPEAVRDEIKARYEAPLKAVFES
jgi:multicomponent K+:H+ antiporter subunit E